MKDMKEFLTELALRAPTSVRGANYTAPNLRLGSSDSPMNAKNGNSGVGNKLCPIDRGQTSLCGR